MELDELIAVMAASIYPAEAHRRSSEAAADHDRAVAMAVMVALEIWDEVREQLRARRQ